jgi:hypothetical protein
MGMGFHARHSHVSQVDLSDPEAVIDLLDLVLPPLDEDSRLMFMPASGTRSTTGTVCLVDEMPERVSVELAVRAMTTAAVTADRIEESPSMLVAVHRRGEHDPRESDMVWVRAAQTACDYYGVRLLGVWLRVSHGQAVRLDAALANRG